MLSPVEIIEQLTIDEFIVLCQLAKPHNFDVLSIRRDLQLLPVVYVELDNGLRERIALGELFLTEIKNG